MKKKQFISFFKSVNLKFFDCHFIKIKLCIPALEINNTVRKCYLNDTKYFIYWHISVSVHFSQPIKFFLKQKLSFLKTNFSLFYFNGESSKEHNNLVYCSLNCKTTILCNEAYICLLLLNKI